MNSAKAFPLLHELLIEWLMSDDDELAIISEADATAAAQGVVDNNQARAEQLNTWLDTEGVRAWSLARCVLDGTCSNNDAMPLLIADLREELTGDFK